MGQHLQALNPKLARYGIKQIFWPAGRRTPYPDEVGPRPDKPYVFNPDMLAWREPHFDVYELVVVEGL